MDDMQPFDPRRLLFAEAANAPVPPEIGIDAARPYQARDDLDQERQLELPVTGSDPSYRQHSAMARLVGGMVPRLR
jgi:hypothetical protein